ncbi:hypothetical protein [Hydrogenophaga sp.]|uniref:hypothetical protein n=1 Tax=Hydrogenophaga sp. TaxID=1904254 RepID=UPI0027198D5C|nr:hypothetical protein [Hydrogenophaga sp.]MDO9434441.1 hypothetical protein [Hydrogenophaga sp.]
MAQHKQGRGTSRQPQGDFGRGSDHAPLGSSDDVNRQLNKVGAYRDAEQPEDENGEAAEVRQDAERHVDSGRSAAQPSPKTPGRR